MSDYDYEREINRHLRTIETLEDEAINLRVLVASLYECLEESEADLFEAKELLEFKELVVERVTSALNRAANLFFGERSTSVH